MQLVMYVGNDFIASVALNPKQLTMPGYIGEQKRRLKNENLVLVKEATNEPEFLLSNFSAPVSNHN